MFTEFKNSNMFIRIASLIIIILFSGCAVSQKNISNFDYSKTVKEVKPAVVQIISGESLGSGFLSIETVM